MATRKPSKLLEVKVTAKDDASGPLEEIWYSLIEMEKKHALEQIKNAEANGQTDTYWHDVLERIDGAIKDHQKTLVKGAKDNG